MCTDHTALIGVASGQPLYASPPLYALRIPPLPLDISFLSLAVASHRPTRPTSRKLAKMSSPSQRRTRGSQSGTPRRSGRQTESNNTPQNGQAGASSPLFFQSSSPAPGVNQDSGPQVSSPLRQQSNSQSTQRNESQNSGLQPSSPLRQMTESQEAVSDGNRTPRASAQARGMSRPFHNFEVTNKSRLVANALRPQLQSRPVIAVPPVGPQE